MHAVGSGVGTAALQLAAALGARVVGTARTPDKLERCRALGLEVGIEPARTADGALDVDALAWAIVEATGGGAHVTLDLVGGDYVIADINAAAPKGASCASARWPAAARRCRSSRSSASASRSSARCCARATSGEKAAATDAFVRDVVPLLADGRIAPVVEAVLPLDRRGRGVRAASRRTRRSARSSSTAPDRLTTCAPIRGSADQRIS